MRIRIDSSKRRFKCFKKIWIKTLNNLGLLSSDLSKDLGVIGEITEDPPYVYIYSPDLPFEVLGVLKEYFGKENIIYENS